MTEAGRAPLVRTLDESVVVIAEGTSGIGLASARALARAGARKIALLARGKERGRSAQAELESLDADADIRFFSVDANVVEDVSRAVDEVNEAFGRIDVLVSSVSPSFKPELFHRTPIEDISSMLTGLARPPMLLTRAVLPFMQEQNGGTIVHVASDAAKVPTPGESVLGAAMAAVVMFTKAVSVEAKRNGIRVNCVTPSLVANTPTTADMLSGGFSKSLFEKAAALASLGIAEPEDVAETLVFLSSPSAARITGQAISVNGGISAV
jgi:2-hydroxycyclohexanecarboxyl-CoA dehydrogenase